MSNQESLAKKQIWVFGAQCAEADRSIQWKDSYPNFADLDILIVNLTLLTIAICDSIDKRAYSQAQEMIWDKFCYGGTLIFITSSWHEHFPPKSRFFGKFECMIPAEKDSKNAKESINLVIRDLKRKYANREPPHNVASDNISDKILSTANSSNKQLADKIQAKDKNETLGIFDKYGSSFSSYELLILAKKQTGKWKIITGTMTLSYAHRPEEDKVVHSIDEELIVSVEISRPRNM